MDEEIDKIIMQEYVTSIEEADEIIKKFKAYIPRFSKEGKETELLLLGINMQLLQLQKSIIAVGADIRTLLKKIEDRTIDLR